MQTNNQHKVLAVWQAPFTLGKPKQATWDVGISLLEMVERMDGIPSTFMKDGIIHVNDIEVPRAQWHLVKPKAHSVAKPITVTMHIALKGGGDEGGKSIIMIIAAIAITILTHGATAGWFATAGGLFAAGSTSAALLAGAISLTGALLLSALSPPPTTTESAQDTSTDSPGAASARGNVLEPNGSIPRVLGTRRIFPPMAFEPIIELIGQNEFVTAVYVFAGAHKLEDLRLGDSTIDEDPEVITDIQIETREGTHSDNAPLNLNHRQGRTLGYNMQMSLHDVDPENPDTILAGAADTPVWHGVSSKLNADEVWISINFQGLLLNTNPTNELRVPFRIRGRRKGDTEWRLFPELHYSGNSQNLLRTQIKFIFRSEFTNGFPSAPVKDNFVEARKVCPAQTLAPTSLPYLCDAYFIEGSGDDSFRRGTEEGSNVINTVLRDSGAEFHLSEADWPVGVYDFEVIRGATIQDNNYDPIDYEYSGDVLDFFFYQGSGEIPMTRTGLQDTTVLNRTTTIWNESPIHQNNFALISIRAKNRGVEQLSVLASAYVNDYDEVTETWSNYTTTSNPAAWFRDILIGELNYNPLPQGLLDEEGILEWWHHCNTEDYTIDLVAQNVLIGDLLRLIASCGYARPFQSDLWGVIQDFDRTSEMPIQMFTSRNSKNVSWAKAFPRLPAGFRVNYIDVLADYASDQLTIYRTGALGTSNRLEQVTYEGFVHEEKVRLRALFDLKQAVARSTFHTLTAPLEWIKCRRGSLVALNHDLLDRQYSQARIVGITFSGADIVSIDLDGEVELFNEDSFFELTDVFARTDVFQVGINTGIAIRESDGSINTYATNGDAGNVDTIIFDAPLVGSSIEIGNLVSIGLLSSQYRRMIVTNIAPASTSHEATITMVDEAPELWEIFE